MSAPPRLRAVLVDDEPLALKRLGRLLDATGRAEVVGRTSDPRETLALVASARAEAVFLDIHMPHMSGLEVAAQLPPGLPIVFTTAYDEHAVAAFELNAVDYLLKPVERARLDATLDRITARRQDATTIDIREVATRLAHELLAAPYLEHLASRTGERVRLLPVGEVTHVFARDRGTYAVSAGVEHMLDVTLAELEHRLNPSRFLRIHRATLVNVGWVAEVHGELGGRLLLRLRGPHACDLVVSRDRVRMLKERLGLS